jgi:hypothetical protein
MSIATQCSKCGQRFSAPDQALGRSVRCSQCGNTFTVLAQASTTRLSLAKEPAKRSLWFSLTLAAMFLAALGTAAFFVWRAFSGGPALDWKEFVSAQGGFTVLMPANPEQKEDDDPKIVAVTKIHEIAAKPVGARSFAVHYYDLPDRPINDFLYFTWLKKRLLEKGGQLRTDNAISPAPYPCREVVVDLAGDQVLVQRVYLAEARVFLLTAEFPKLPAPTPEPQKFFDSFKITSVPKVAKPAVVAQAEPQEPPPAPKKAPEPPVAKAEPAPKEQETPKKAPEPPVVAKGDSPPPAEKPAQESPAPKKPEDAPPLAKADPPAPKKADEAMPEKGKDPPTVAQANDADKSSDVKHARSLQEIRSTLAQILTPDKAQADDPTRALRRRKAYRYLVEVPYTDLVLDDQYNKFCLAGAALCEKIGKVDHKPKNPGMPEKDFRIASQGTAKSNICVGSKEFSLAVDSFMDDSDAGNIAQMIHRRWCLNPLMQKTGFGRSGIYSAMYAADNSRVKIPEYDYLCYPARGLMPIEFFGDRYAWNVMLNPKKFKAPGKDFVPKVYEADAQGLKKGEPVALDFKAVDTAFTNVPSSIIFRPEKIDLTPGTMYVVELNGLVQQGSGKRVDVSYLVEFMRLNEAKEPPALAKGTPSKDGPASGKKEAFVISPEDKALIDEINRFRKGEKVEVVESAQELFEAARRDAKNLSEGKPLPEIRDLRYSGSFRYSFPVVGALSAREMVASMTATKAMRAQVADEDLHYIGIGSQVGANGQTYYMFLFCGKKL